MATLANHQLCILTVTTELGVHFIFLSFEIIIIKLPETKAKEHELYNIVRVLACLPSPP